MKEMRRKKAFSMAHQGSWVFRVGMLFAPCSMILTWQFVLVWCSESWKIGGIRKAKYFNFNTFIFIFVALHILCRIRIIGSLNTMELHLLGFISSHFFQSWKKWTVEAVSVISSECDSYIHKINCWVEKCRLSQRWRNVVLVRGGVGEGENNPLGRHAEREDWFRGEEGGQA